MRKRDPGYYEARRDDLIECVPESAQRILEVGCGTAETGRAIKARCKGPVEVTGVEVKPEIAEKARANIDKVFAGDAGILDLKVRKKYFDCIIYGDVLEHLMDPWNMLARHRELLKDDGCIVASIPNVSHYRVIKMLLSGQWDYAHRGILDRSHVRFFTLKSIKAMFSGADLDIVKTKRKLSGSKVKKALNKILFGAIKEYITEQYIVVARKRA
ncbi:class I SAM-dependent methyltransferase [Candidatus Omnitrophota bacterium]